MWRTGRYREQAGHVPCLAARARQRAAAKGRAAAARSCKELLAPSRRSTHSDANTAGAGCTLYGRRAMRTRASAAAHMSVCAAAAPRAATTAHGSHPPQGCSEPRLETLQAGHMSLRPFFWSSSCEPCDFIASAFFCALACDCAFATPRTIAARVWGKLSFFLQFFCFFRP